LVGTDCAFGHKDQFTRGLVISEARDNMKP
jgi:hypothetical protein